MTSIRKMKCVFLESLVKFFQNRRAEEKIKCSENETLLSSPDLIFKKKNIFGTIECDDLIYGLVGIEGARGRRWGALETYDRTGTRINQIRFDMKTAWKITLLLLDMVNEKPEAKQDAGG